MISEQWDPRIPSWDLQAEPRKIQKSKAVVLVNGKPSEFADVHDGPAVYIGRSNDHYDLSESSLHNPFSVQDHGRLESVLKYAEHLVEQVQQDQKFREAVWRCHGRPVACWCVPELCHGHVLNLFLTYRLRTDWNLETIQEQIQDRVRSHVDYQIQQGNANPAEYQA